MDPSHSILMLILAFFLVALNAFFVLSEFSIVKIRKSKLEEFVAADVANARLALKISNSLDTYLSATQLGITISSLALGWIGEPAVSKLIEGPLKNLFGAGEIFIHTMAFVIAFIIVTLFHVVLGELVPKSLAIAKTEKTVLFIVRPLYLFWFVFLPFIKIFDICSAVTLKIFGIKSNQESETHSEEEIKIIASESLKGGILDSVETLIIKNAVDFSDTVAKEIMTPRKDMVCLNKQKSYDENYAALLDAKFMRFPYIDGNKDNVLGMIHIRDLIQTNEKDFNKIVRKILIVPENSSIATILSMMNKERISAALVVDEYGGTAGFLTMEDIIEEIFGDINDEHDGKDEDFRKIDENCYEFSGRFELDEIENLMQISLENDAEQLTIGGYVFNLLERLPVEGDKISDSICEYEVLKMNANSISLVRVTKLAQTLQSE